MTLADLKAMCEQLTEEGISDETQVEVQYQPNYPLKCSIRGFTTALKMVEAEYDEAEHDEDDQSVEEVKSEATEVIYLVSGSDNGYGDKAAWETCERM